MLAGGRAPAGQGSAGRARQGRAGQGRAGQGKGRAEAEQSRAEQSRAEQSRGQGRAGQGRAGQGRAGQGSTHDPNGGGFGVLLYCRQRSHSRGGVTTPGGFTLPHRLVETLGRGPRSEPRAPMQMVSGALGSLGFGV